MLINFFKISDNVGLDETFDFCKISLNLVFPSAMALKHSLTLLSFDISSFKNPSASDKSLDLFPTIKSIKFSFTVFLSSIN